MTVRGSVAAIPLDDDAWDDRAEYAFLRFLPVMLEEVLAAPGPLGLLDAIARGAEELVPHVEATIEGLDAELLLPLLLDEVPFAPERSDGLWSLVFHEDRADVRLPLVSAGVTLCDLVVRAQPGRWVPRQDRVHLRRYADLVAPILHGSLTNQALRAAALTDQLTGLANRRALDRELDRLCEAGRSVSLLLLDIDGLKEVNDSLGYEQGDHLITALAAALRETVGRDHVVARMGGDEFVVILPDSSQKDVKKRARKVRRALERQPLPPAVAAVSRGVSVGVVEGRPGETPRQLVRRAARSMRSQKRRRASDRG